MTDRRRLHRIRCSLLNVLILVLLALALACPALAIDLAAPSSLYTYEMTVTGQQSPGYYYLDPYTVAVFPPGQRGNSMILDNSGEIVWFAIPPRGESALSNVQRHPDGRYSVSDGIRPTFTRFYDDDWRLVDFLPTHHPDFGGEQDAHEVYANADGSFWTLWVHWETVDMSDLWPGGNPNANVGFHVIEKWDADHNVLWSWDSYDHLDALPIVERTQTGVLDDPEFEHLHANAIDELPDGDVLISGREHSIIFRVDRDTGEVLWRFGGGPLNDFTIVRGDGVPDNRPLEFYCQHDARHVDGNRYTVFDNGNHHEPWYSYAREYVLDETEMTAELVVALPNSPPSYALIQGSHQVLPDGHRVVGWGNMYPEVNVTEFDESGNVVMQLALDPDDELWDTQPGMYRAHKYATFTPSAAPYVCVVMGSWFQPDRLYANWFGHEDEVAAYQIFAGPGPDNLSYRATTTAGIWELDTPENDLTWYFRIRALDGDGAVISPWSNTWEVRHDNDRFELVPAVDHVPASGGMLSYAISYAFSFTTPVPALTYWTEVIAPDGVTYGPLLSVPVTVPQQGSGVVHGFTQPVPPFAPPGMYRFTGSLGLPGIAALQGSFLFHKHAGGVTNETVHLSRTGWRAGRSGWSGYERK